tara:strand:- start:4439 stop:5956 length:1518 start_codon:yes stop_codon:yes gene_type:complete
MLIGTSYIPFPPWAALFGFVPLWIFLIEQKSPKKAFIGGWITSFLLTLIGFYWVAYVSREHGNIPWAVAFLVMLFFCLTATYYIPVCSWIWVKWIQPRCPAPGWKWVMLATLFAAGEKLYLTLFPWNFGYTWAWVQLPIAQTAEWWGIDGLSTITIFFSAAFGWCWQHRKTNKPLAKKVLWGSLAMFLGLNLMGEAIRPDISKADKHLNVLLIQGNVGNLQKEQAQRGYGFRTEIVQKYMQLTKKALVEHAGKPIDFIVWPETATPLRLSQHYQSRPNQRRLLNFVKSMKQNLVTGAYHENPETGGVSNSLFVIDKLGRTQKPYQKTHLLAFGEYFPIISQFPELEDKLGLGSFERGKGPISMPVGGVKIGPQICYESLFPLFSRGLTEAGSDVFVNLTNDSWFGPFSEPFQNMIMTLARSIEFRRPTLRATNTGFTTAMDAAGNIYERSQWFTEQAMYIQLPLLPREGKTFFHIFPFLSEVALGLLLVLFIFRIRKYPGNTNEV